nr:MAG TPA: Erv1 / Alr family protein [Caudoviricetes sp.]
MKSYILWIKLQYPCIQCQSHDYYNFLKLRVKSVCFIGLYPLSTIC